MSEILGLFRRGVRSVVWRSSVFFVFAANDRCVRFLCCCSHCVECSLFWQAMSLRWDLGLSGWRSGQLTVTVYLAEAAGSVDLICR